MKKSKLLSLGIDVSKQHLDLAYLYENEHVRYKRVKNNKQAINSLVSSLNKTHRSSEFVVILEPTGDLHLLVCYLLSVNSFRVKCVNPLLTKQLTKYSIRGAKSDKKDSLTLASMVKLQKESLKYADFKLSLQDIALKKSISALSRIEKLIQEYTLHLKRHKETLSCFGLEDEDTYQKQILSDLKKEKARLENKIITLSKDMLDNVSEAVKQKGVTNKSLAVVLGLLKDKSFKNKDALTAYAGLDIRLKRSGTYKGKEKLSKRGNSFLRKKLYQIAWGLVMHSQEYKEYYLSLKQRGLHYTTCLIAVARKFLKSLYPELKRLEKVSA